MHDVVSDRQKAEGFFHKATAAAFLAGAVYFAAVLVGSATRLPGEVAGIWIANALALTFLMRQEKAAWALTAPAIFVAGFAAHFASGAGGVTSAGLMAANLLEVLLAASIIRLWYGPDLRFRDDLSAYFRVQAVAALLTPVIGAAAGATILVTVQGGTFAAILASWWSASAMGAIVVLPLVLSATPETVRNALTGRNALELAGFALTTVVVVYGAAWFLAYPFVLLALVLAAAAMRLSPFATAVVSALGLFVVLGAGFSGDTHVPSGGSILNENAFHVSAALSIVLPFAISLLVTQLRGDRARIAESEERFRSAMEHSAIGMALVGLDGSWLRINPATCDLLGYTWQELREKTFQDLTHPDDVDTDLDLVRRCIAGEIDSYRMEKRYFRKDGSIVWALLVVAIMRDQETQAPLYFISQIEDITARKEAEAQLAASESRWNFALEGARQGVWDVNLTTMETYLSPVWKALIGYTDEEFGNDPELWLEHLHPDDVEQVIRKDEGHRAGLVDSFENEFRMRHKDGHWVWILDRGKVMGRDAEGKPLRLIGTHTDISGQKAGEEKIRILSERMSRATRAGKVGLWELDPATGEVWWDEGNHLVHGTDAKTFQPQNLRYLIHPDDRGAFDTYLTTVMAGKPDDSRGYRIVTPEGELRHIRSTREFVRDARGALTGVVGANWDITQEMALTEAYAEEKERLRVTLESIGDAVICTDRAQIVTFMNPIAARLTGWRPAEAIGRPVGDIFRIVDEHSGERLGGPVSECLATLAPVSATEGVQLVSKDGKRIDIRDTVAPVKTADDRVIGTVLVFQDTTRERKLQRQIAHSAAHDDLTKLRNRVSFERELETACREAAREGRIHSVCFIDLDRFKPVNDEAGHAAGDALLQEIGAILKACVRGQDLTARLGGDEFGLLLLDCPAKQAAAISEKLIQSIIGARFDWEGRTFSVGASIGVRQIPETEATPSSVLKDADMACYEAKARGRGRVQVFEGDPPPAVAAAG